MPCHAEEAAPTDSAAKPGEKPDEKGPVVETAPEAPRGPAQDFLLGASFGATGGATTATGNVDTKGLYGAAMHAFAGWAWSVRKNQSVGTSFFFDGVWDRERSTGPDTRLARRMGADFFVIGEKAHLKAGLGFANTRLNARDYSGLGLAFTSGFHVPFKKSAVANAKHAVFTAEVALSWDFLVADDDTIHRLGFGLRLGLALY